MTHESKVSLETLKYCRDLAKGEEDEWAHDLRVSGGKLPRKRLDYCRSRLAELDAEIAAKEAERDA